MSPRDDRRKEESDTEADDSEWRFSIDEVGPEAESRAEPEPLEPGSPSLEHVAFVLIGVVGTLLLLATAL